MKMMTPILLLFFAHSATAQETRHGELAGRPVEMAIVAAEDLSPRPWPQHAVELTQTAVTVTQSSNIYRLLQTNGVAPDPGAFALVYDLNPALRDVNRLRPDTVVQLPSILSGNGLSKLLQDRNLVELTVDPELRHELNKRIEALQLLIPSISQLTEDANVQSQIINLIGWYQQIEKRFERKTDPPLRQPTLIELRDEADLLEAILGNALHQSRKLTTEEQTRVAAIHEDVKLEITQYGQVLANLAPMAQAFYSVTVNIKGLDPKRLQSLRVYYTYNGLFRPLPAEPPIMSLGFTNLGSGTSKNLLMKSYQIWAANDGDPNHPVTPPYSLRIESDSPKAFSVDLSIAHAAPQ